MAAGGILGTPEGEHLGEDTPVEEHLDSLVEEELPVDTLVEVEHLVCNLEEKLPEDNLVEEQLQTEAGSTPAVGRQGPVQGSQAEQGGSDRHRGCNHLAWVCRAGAGMAWACLLGRLGMGGDQELLHRDSGLQLREQQLAAWVGEQSCQCWKC